MSNTEDELALSDLGTELDGSVLFGDLGFLWGLQRIIRVSAMQSIDLNRDLGVVFAKHRSIKAVGAIGGSPC